MDNEQFSALRLASECEAGEWAPNIVQNESALRDRVADKLRRQYAEIERLRALLAEAGALFRFYEQSHRAKGPDHKDKADRNAEIAGRIKAALTPPSMSGADVRTVQIPGGIRPRTERKPSNGWPDTDAERSAEG